MDINEVKKLIKIVESSKISEFSIQEGDLKIRISKDGKSKQNVVYHAAPSEIPASVTPQTTAAAPQSEKPVESNDDTNFHIIKSPIVGTFYRAPAPDADAYVQVGDSISEGSILCIVEAMKLMNEIESDASGKIVEILVENGTPVEFNQPLFKIQK